MTTTTDRSTSQDHNVYFDYKFDDTHYFGAEDVVRAELELIKTRRGRDPQNLAGLALSGGGIRSASYALGVLQALAYRGWLKDIDYLSTVSGGGYIGSCLSYLLHRTWKDPNASNATKTGEIRFGLEPDKFPLGSYPMTGHALDANRRALPATLDVYDRTRGEMLRFLRQNASYLSPGKGINLLTLVAVVLRNSLLSLSFFLALATLVFATLELSGLLPESKGLPAVWRKQWLITFAAGFGALFLLLAPVYGPFTWFSGRFLRPGRPYLWRRRFEVALTLLLGFGIGLAIVGSVPYAWTYLQAVKLAKTGLDWGVLSSAASAVAGLASCIAAFYQTGRTKKPLVPTGLLVAIAATTLLFALLVGGYALADKWVNGWVRWGFLALAVVVTGWLVNLNYLSLHRYYRDRLMETFMPNVSEALDRSKPEKDRRAIDGSKTLLRELWGGHDAPHSDKNSVAPYHIINANAVLVSSKISKFRGRGGDNFIFTPLYCGSNATGWAGTASPLYRNLTLASAMAISGAAVNPNAGCGGQGATRQPVLAALMGVLNIRLGYWLPNPKWLTHRKGYSGPEKKPVGTPITRVLTRISAFGDEETPNFLYPGLGEVILHNTLNENSCLLSLSDGGHFENLGLYELVRRRLKFIIVCDGTADPGFRFTDLANALEKIRADFGALILFDDPGIEALVPTSKPHSKQRNTDGGPAMRRAERGYLTAKIRYANNDEGTLIYLTTTFFKCLSADLYGYRRTRPEFPDEPTSDQFFDESQFEAYRELGYQTAYLMTRDPAIVANQNVKNTIRAVAAASSP